MVGRRRRVNWTRAALHTLDEAAGYVAVDSPEAAAKLADRILSAAESLQTLANRGRRVPEFPDPGIRELFVRPFRLIYGVRDDEVKIIALIHAARDLGRWRGDY